MTERPAPLAGLRIIDLSQNLAGPFCTQILADLGADVIKVEPPGGDPARDWAPPQWGSDGTMFLSVNRGKRSITLDLKRDDARAVLDALVASADVFVESFRRGVVERLGYGADVLRERHPALIYCSVRAYGADGPLADLPGYDALAQAHGGLISVTGQRDAPARVGTSVVDYGTGTWAALAILAALREGDRTGAGSHVTAALYETAINYNAYHLMGYFADGTVPRRHGTGFPAIAPYGAFRAADGELMIAGANDALFHKLCDALGLQDVARDARWQSNPQRVADEAALRERILQCGTWTQEYQAKMFGGGNMFADITQGRAPSVAQANVTHGVRIFEQLGFQVQVMDVGGERFRSVSLPLETGEVWVRYGPRRCKGAAVSPGRAR